jgi:hypothetical protein
MPHMPTRRGWSKVPVSRWKTRLVLGEELWRTTMCPPRFNRFTLAVRWRAASSITSPRKLATDGDISGSVSLTDWAANPSLREPVHLPYGSTVTGLGFAAGLVSSAPR